MSYQIDKEFRKYYEKYSEKQLKNMMDLTYDTLYKKFNKDVNFGFNGCKDFLGAVLLLKYDKSVEKNIGYGLCMIFDGKCDPLDFSEFMDNIIEKSIISMEDWIDVYDYLETHHKWIESHKCA
ncbi:MAG: hypothetical protein RSG52_15395 [Terrisporobacter sp.]|uniref:hypothetical protein n=1 Tax=Terrisporobacter sp. TaxID=1965305 RepID=UPI002FC7A2F4